MVTAALMTAEFGRIATMSFFMFIVKPPSWRLLVCWRGSWRNDVAHRHSGPLFQNRTATATPAQVWAVSECSLAAAGFCCRDGSKLPSGRLAESGPGTATSGNLHRRAESRHSRKSYHRRCPAGTPERRLAAVGARLQFPKPTKPQAARCRKPETMTPTEHPLQQQEKPERLKTLKRWSHSPIRSDPARLPAAECAGAGHRFAGRPLRSRRRRI